MPTVLFTKIYNFLTTAEEGDITAGSVIYLAMKENPWASEGELRSLIEQAVASANINYNRASSHYVTLYLKFSQNLKNIGAVTIDEEILNSEEISENIIKLKRKLKKDTSALSLELYRRIGEVTVSELPWNDPLANQIISDDSDIIRLLPDELRNIFMVGIINS
ncbi:20771_t:CDS:2 [Entrophospora sp. SA101]|nr:20771_t:CDS:2 [Entrophospora sp. SA101]